MDTLPSMEPFQLAPQLEKDTVAIGDFPLCRVLLMNDANYPWIILVPRMAGLEEIYQLSETDQQQLLKESSFVAQTLKDVFTADKMNVAALGNMVRQLHVHHIVRYQSDSAWPAPVWGLQPTRQYDDSALKATVEKLQSAFAAMLVSGQ
ncbi:HIT domain-containing protein [Spongorhabdus nitratireducens]